MQPFPAPLAIDYEHVCLTSDEPDEVVPILVRGAIAAELSQSAARVDRRLIIFDRSYLSVRTTRSESGTRMYSLNIAFLDPRPTRPTSPLLWGIACFLVLVSVSLVLRAVYSGSPPGAGMVVAVAAAVTAALLGLGAALYRSFDRLDYSTRHGRIPVLRLMRNRPDRRRVKTFVRTLEQAIEQAAAARSGPRRHLLRDEMKEHRRLLQAGVLQPTDFEAAKARILRAHG